MLTERTTLVQFYQERAIPAAHPASFNRLVLDAALACKAIAILVAVALGGVLPSQCERSRGRPRSWMSCQRLLRPPSEWRCCLAWCPRNRTALPATGGYPRGNTC